jgi:hypothetical protein
MRKKYRITFNRIGEPGSLLQTVLYVQHKESERPGEMASNREIEIEFNNYFSSKRYAFKRATELPITVQDEGRTNSWFIDGGDR